MHNWKWQYYMEDLQDGADEQINSQVRTIRPTFPNRMLGRNPSAESNPQICRRGLADQMQSLVIGEERSASRAKLPLTGSSKKRTP